MPEGAEVRIIAEELNEYLKNKNLILRSSGNIKNMNQLE